MAPVLAHSTEILILLFILLTFLYSGLEKLTDWKGQIEWFQEHLKDTFLVPLMPLLLGVLIVLDFAIAILSILGLFMMLKYQDMTYGLYACIVAGITLLFLLFGQRTAKDFQGAFTIVGYFMVVLFGVWIFSK